MGSLSVEAIIKAMKISLFILILSCFNGIFCSWVYSQRPYFHWIKNLKLSDLKKDSPPPTTPAPVRAVTPRSGEISGDKSRRQQTGGQRPSFSSFFSKGSLNTEARSRDNLGNLRFQHIDQNLKVPLVPGDTKVMTSIRVIK